jgi:hypothetical protein
MSPKFNGLVYGDLVFLSAPVNMSFQVLIDDAIRYTTIRAVDYKDYSCLEKSFRRGWISLFGPMNVFRTDKEAAYASDQFGIYLEKIGTRRELVESGQYHGPLSVLDRRIELLRTYVPLLIDALSTDHIIIEADDLACELELVLNTSLTYKSVSPYMCLYGAMPKELWREDLEQISAYSDTEPFYEHLHVRSRAIQTFQSAILAHRLERAATTRPRKGDRGGDESQYVAGALVDIWRNPKVKGLQGWRGPATVLGIISGNLIAVRWQGVTVDAPMHHVRPHLSAVSAPQVVAPPPGLPAPSPLAAAVADWDKDELEDLNKALEGHSHFVKTSIFTMLTSFPIDDQYQQINAHFDTLTVVTASMPLGEVQIHAVSSKNNVLVFSQAAQRDMHVLFDIGKAAADVLKHPNYIGIVFGKARRHVSLLPEVSKYHLYYWFEDPEVCSCVTLDKHLAIDVSKIIDIADIARLHVVCILEGPSDPALPLSQLLEKVNEEPVPVQQEGRVRVQFSPEPDPLRLDSQSQWRMPENNDSIDPSVQNHSANTSEFFGDDELSASEVMACKLRGISHKEYRQDVAAAKTYRNLSRDHRRTFV